MWSNKDPSQTEFSLEDVSICTHNMHVKVYQLTSLNVYLFVVIPISSAQKNIRTEGGKKSESELETTKQSLTIKIVLSLHALHQKVKLSSHNFSNNFFYVLITAFIQYSFYPMSPNKVGHSHCLIFFSINITWAEHKI